MLHCFIAPLNFFLYGPSFLQLLLVAVLKKNCFAAGNILAIYVYGSEYGDWVIKVVPLVGDSFDGKTNP